MRYQGQKGIDKVEDICYISIRYKKGGKRNEKNHESKCSGSG